MAIPGRLSPRTGEAKVSKAERKRTKMRGAQSESGARGRRAGQRTGKPSGMARSLLFPSCIVLKVRHERVFPRESLRKNISETERFGKRYTPRMRTLKTSYRSEEKRNRVKQGTGRRREAETLKEAGR